MKPYELLIRSNSLGEYQGAHVIETDGGLPRPIEPADWPDIVKGINSTTLKKSQAYNALLKEHETLKLTLTEHQTLTDQGMTAARPLIETLVATGDVNAIHLATIFETFAAYGTAREKIKLTAETLDLERKLAELTAQLAAKRLALTA